MAAGFHESGGQYRILYTTCFFVPYKLKIYIATYMMTQLNKKSQGATKEEEQKTGSSPPSGNINPNADFAICTVYRNKALGSPNGEKEERKRKNWAK